MKKEFLAASTKFVYSKNELGYQEVLDCFSSANAITIITYNISERNSALIQSLRKAGEHCVINVVTNIPSRWDTYYGDTFRQKARRQINLYLAKLNPANLGIQPSVFFDFSNHGKIIMTDSIVYVGSANYSEESQNSTEFGFISRDKNLIDYIATEVLPDIQKAAVPYYEYDYTALLLEANVMLSALYNSKNNLYEEVYRLHDDVDGEWYYYVDYEANLSVYSLDGAVQITGEACKVASNIYDAIDVITSSNEEELDAANALYEELLKLCSYIEEIRNFDSLVDLSEFSSEAFVNQKLQNEYALEASEENLESCIESASSAAVSEVWDLTQAAKEDVDELLATMDKFSATYSVLVENLWSKQIKKISDKINNT